MKGLRIGRRRGRDAEQTLSPLELALRPALVDGRWQVPDRFNFTRDVVEALARDPKRRALTYIGTDGVIEPRTFLEIAEGAAFWALTLRERGVAPGDRVIVMAGSTVDWLESVLGVWKVGGVVVPCMPSTSPPQLERLVSSTDATLVVTERSLEPTIGRMGFTPDVHLYDPGVRHTSKDLPPDVPTYDTASKDLAFVVPTSGATGARKEVAHTHGSVFATRVQAEHWLDVGRGDTVWCTADTESPLTMWNSVVGPWSRGAEVALHHGPFEVEERLDLLFKLGASILLQSPAEYRALAERPKLERFRSTRLRRLLSTGDFLDPDVVAVFEERWGLSIVDGYSQAETNVVVGNLADGALRTGSIGRALPGHHVAVIDDQGNELAPGVEGDLAVRGRPPTLFAGYWELPEETKSAFLGDWYLTGDVAHVDEEGYFTFVGRAEDVISSSGRTFGPREVELALAEHPAIAATAVVGIRDLQRGGHFVRAFVVPRNPAGGSEQLEAEVRQYVAETLPTQQVPREIVFVDELPMAGWKVSRHELRERPLPVRPLWETPEPAPQEPTTASFDAEFSPRIESPPVPAPPVASVVETAAVEPVVPAQPEPVAPEPVVPEPVVPEPVVPEPVVPVAPEPAPTAAAPVEFHEPVLEQEPVAEPIKPAAEALPTPEPELEPGPAPAAEAERAPEPEPPAAFAPVPEPAVALPDTDSSPAESPPASLAAPEPVARVESVPEPPAAEAAPAYEPEVEIAPETLAGVEAEEPPPASAATPDPVLAAEPVWEPWQPEPEPAAEPDAASAPSEPELPPPVELTVVEPDPLPDFVIESPGEVAPVVVPDPEPEPDLSGPLPDYVVGPDARQEPELAPAPRVTPLPVPEEGEEEDLGPLPDFVIDPNDPEAARRPPPPPPPEPEPILAPRPKSPVEEAPSEPTLNFPSAASFSVPRSRDDAGERESRPSRPRPQAEVKPSKRSTAPAEPGDEGQEVSWMEGLSNRLSAYSLSEEEEAEAEDDAQD